MAIPLYRLWRKLDNFVWDNEADEALESLKKQLTQAPILAAPKPKEPMLLYISANNLAVILWLLLSVRNPAVNTPYRGHFSMLVRSLLYQSNATLTGSSWSLASL